MSATAALLPTSVSVDGRLLLPNDAIGRHSIVCRHKLWRRWRRRCCVTRRQSRLRQSAKRSVAESSLLLTDSTDDAASPSGCHVCLCQWRLALLCHPMAVMTAAVGTTFRRSAVAHRRHCQCVAAPSQRRHWRLSILCRRVWWCRWRRQCCVTRWQSRLRQSAKRSVAQSSLLLTDATDDAASPSGCHVCLCQSRLALLCHTR